jgi:hypothetical protein
VPEQAYPGVRRDRQRIALGLKFLVSSHCDTTPSTDAESSYGGLYLPLLSEDESSYGGLSL